MKKITLLLATRFQQLLSFFRLNYTIFSKEADKMNMKLETTN